MTLFLKNQKNQVGCKNFPNSSVSHVSIMRFICVYFLSNVHTSVHPAYNELRTWKEVIMASLKNPGHCVK
jgi:hypothetical protein